MSNEHRNVNEQTTHFGYQNVPIEEKAEKVAAVFHSVADNYDLMNDLMSMGIHRIWKELTILTANARPGYYILDLAGGTGDLASQFAQQVGQTGCVVLGDINNAMLQQGRNKLIDQGIMGNVSYSQCDAEKLPFTNNTFNVVTIAFGLRNVTRQLDALKSMYRVIKPGGQILILEFSKPVIPLIKPIYDFYSFKILPKLGEWVAKDSESYRYLAESIRMHPDQPTLKSMMEEAGFEDCDYYNLTGGIVALHRGFKF